MKNLLLFPFLNIFVTLTAHAVLLTPEGTGPTVERLSLGAAVLTTVEGESVKLQSVGAGLRSKKVVFVNVKVYVGQLFVQSLESFKKSDNEALSSLKDQNSVAFQLHFVRDVDAENVKKSFREALKANNIDTEESSIKQFLDSVSQGGEAKEGKTLTILGAKLKDGSEQVSYETTSGNISQIKGPTGFIGKIFAIWLGKPADSGVADLKKFILK